MRDETPTVRSPNFFMAGMFRAGGMHIINSFCRMTGYRWASTAGSQGNGEEDQTINPIAATILFPYGGFAFHQHSRAFATNLMVLNAYQIRPIVLVRNLADSLLSVVEKIDTNVGTDGCIPGLYVPGGWASLGRDRKLAWAVNNVAPWQLSFFASWYEASVVRNEIECLFVRYEEFYADQDAGFRRICAHVGVSVNEALLSQVVKDVYYRKIGVSGRGQGLFQPLLLEAQTYSWGPALREQMLKYLF